MGPRAGGPRAGAPEFSSGITRVSDACIAGAGGIGSAVSVLLRQFYGMPVDIYIGDINAAAREKAVRWIADSGAQATILESFDMSADWQSDFESRGVNVDIILDCLPGRFAPSTAKAALRLGAHYVNLTEYVDETKEKPPENPDTAWGKFGETKESNFFA